MTRPKKKPLVPLVARVYETIVSAISSKPMNIAELRDHVNKSLNTSFRDKQFEKAIHELRRRGISVEESDGNYAIKLAPSSLRLQELLRDEIDYRFN